MSWDRGEDTVQSIFTFSWKEEAPSSSLTRDRSLDCDKGPRAGSCQSPHLGWGLSGHRQL